MGFSLSTGPITEAQLPSAISKYYGDSEDRYRNDQRDKSWDRLVEVMRGTGWVLGLEEGMPAYWHPSYKFDGEPTSWVHFSVDYNGSSYYDIYIWDSEREYDFHFRTSAAIYIKPLLEAFGV